MKRIKQDYLKIMIKRKEQIIKMNKGKIHIYIIHQRINQAHQNLIQLSYRKMLICPILVLIFMIGLSVYGFIRDYSVLNFTNHAYNDENKKIDISQQLIKQSFIRFSCSGLKIKLNDEILIINDSKAPKEDDLAINNWIGDEDQINKKIKEKLEEQQNAIQDLEESIIQQETEIQVLKPVLSENIYVYNELQNGVRILFIQSNTEGIHLSITLNIGKKSDPFDKPGLTQLLFRCQSTNFSIYIYNNSTKLTTQLNLFEELNPKLQKLYIILKKSKFIDIENKAKKLFDFQWLIHNLVIWNI